MQFLFCFLTERVFFFFLASHSYSPNLTDQSFYRLSKSFLHCVFRRELSQSCSRGQIKDSDKAEPIKMLNLHVSKCELLSPVVLSISHSWQNVLPFTIMKLGWYLNLIGVLVPNLATAFINPFYLEFLLGICSILDSQGYYNWNIYKYSSSKF